MTTGVEVDAALEEAAAELASEGFTEDVVTRAIERFERVPVATEEDECLKERGVIRLMDVFLEVAPAEVRETIAANRAALQESYERKHGEMRSGDGLSQASAPIPGDLAGRVEGILDDYAAGLEEEGFSEYRLDGATLALGQLQEAEGEHDEEGAVLEGLRRLIDMTLPHAPAELAAGLTTVREQLAPSSALFDDSDLTAEAFRDECARILATMQQSLEGGESPGPAFTNALMALQVLGGRIDEDDEVAYNALIAATFELPNLLKPFVPEGMEATFLDVEGLLGTLSSVVEASGDDDDMGQAILTEKVVAELQRFAQTPVFGVLGPEADAFVPHLRQFQELLPALMGRFSVLSDLGADDQAEIDRMDKRVQDTFKLMRAATTEAQIIHHQRASLRRCALDLARFERRRHLTVARPDLPTTPVTPDPNRVFFSGSEPVRALVRAAGRGIALDLAEKFAPGSKRDTRWEQLRGSGLAVLDYSDYEPERADPQGPVASTIEGETRVLSAAGPVATVAYETGWAYVLGTPMVAISRAGRPVPFDIDLETVELEGDEGDSDRLIAGMQLAIYGGADGAAGDCLEQTVNDFRIRYGSLGNEKVSRLLDGLSDTRDATRVRYVLAAAIDQLDGERPLLVTPFLPGGYASAAAPRLFHVSAFRDWSAVAQDEVSAACARAGVEYQIGSGRLDPDIIASIWTDICRASAVVADITNLNPNALLELAMAQALGRPTLVLTQNEHPHTYLPAIEKVRTHRYDPSGGRGELASLLDRFLAHAV